MDREMRGRPAVVANGHQAQPQHHHHGGDGHQHGEPEIKQQAGGNQPPSSTTEEPEIPVLEVHHVDHGHGEDVLFAMPRPAFRRDLLEYELRPKQGFFGGEKSGKNDHMNPRTVMWQAPDTKPVGLLLLFHGCNHDGSDWFNGPAERRIVAHALKQGMVTVAMQAGARHGAKCWHNDWPVVINNDVIAIRSCLTHFLQHSTVAPGLPEALRYNPALRRLPAMVFLYMKGDTTWASKSAIGGQVDKLKERRITAEAFEQESQPVTVAFLTSYLDLPADRIARIHKMLVHLEAIEESGKLKADPRSSEIGKRVTDALKAEEDSYDWKYWQYGVQQAMNIAEGVHELSYEKWPEVLAWMRKTAEKKST